MENIDEVAQPVQHNNLLGKRPPPKTSQLELEKQYTYYSCSFLKQRQVQSPLSSSQDRSDDQGISDMEVDSTVELGITQLTESRCVKKNLIANGEASDSQGSEEKKAAKKAKKVQKSNADKFTKRYEFGVIYKKANAKMGVRKFKVLAAGDNNDRFARPDQIAKSRKKYGKLIIDSENFDRLAYEKCGRFFNKKFWEINLKWGSGDSFATNLVLIDQFLVELSGATQ